MLLAHAPGERQVLVAYAARDAIAELLEVLALALDGLDPVGSIDTQKLLQRRIGQVETPSSV